MGEDYKAREATLYAEQAKDVDIIVTTALILGKPAPRILTADMVASMKPGSVIVDMAAANGGNVEGTVKDQAIVTDNGVTIIGYTDLAGRLPAQASQLYGTNLVNLLAAHPGEERPPHPRLRRRGATVDDRGARRRGHLAAAAGSGLRRRTYGHRRGAGHHRGEAPMSTRRRLGVTSPRPLCCSP